MVKDEAAPAGRPAIPSFLPVLPLKNTVALPRMMVPLGVGRARSLQLLDDLPSGDRLIATATQLDEDVEDARWDDIHHVGTMVRIQHYLKLPDGSVQIAVHGLRRIRLTRVLSDDRYTVAAVEAFDEQPDPEAGGLEREALVRTALTSFQQVVMAAPYLGGEALTAAMAIEEPLHLAYFIAHHVRLSASQRQRVLEGDSARQKLTELIGLMAHELEVLELGRRIQTQAEEQVGRAQREFFLREQLRSIRQELGEIDADPVESDELRERIAKSPMPDEARREAERELNRLERVPTASPEHSVIRTYLDLLVSLPWGVTTEGELDVKHAREVLDADHYDLDKVKQRIVEHLAVRKLKRDRGSGERGREPILCFVGPPGVGKTSLGQSIANAMGRKFVRASLGGVHDEAEVRGHRRTYIGAMPGRIIQALRRAESSDPVFMLDEVDKLAADWRGDPSSALLEVLDPEQNREFRDNYLDVPFDLSKVMFITTANTLDTVPAALRDRMEVLQLAGYTEDEKVQIASRFLLPRQQAAHGLVEGEVDLPAASIRVLVRQYTREAGVRSLERELASCLRRAAAQIAGGGTAKVTVDAPFIREAIGKRRFHDESAERFEQPGIATGLTWSPTGGEIIFVEAALVPGKGRLHLTGQLGEVMKESASAALTYLKSRAGDLGIPAARFEDADVHIHVPAGGQPKEGPSAGVTVLSALASLLTGIPVASDLAMTGEITLRGRVLPIGGLKEKVLAAHRAGVHRVLVPSRNEADLDDIPAELRREIQITMVDSIDDVLAVALPGLAERLGAAHGAGPNGANGARPAPAPERDPGSSDEPPARGRRRAARVR